ncbi:hypothetical protein OF83DRAFT_433871 [Amylostereum chailletii]|nr:hypothetical protein OF83DRAFT_433871 [Amylostereum chailletii]
MRPPSLPADLHRPLLSSPSAIAAPLNMHTDGRYLIQLLLSALSSTRKLATEREFSERFKYVIISSTLLSSSISSPPSSNHGHSNSADSSRNTVDISEIPSERPPPQHPPVPPTSLPWHIIAICSLSLLFLLSGSVPFSVLLATTAYYLHTRSQDTGNGADPMKPTLNTLNELVATSNLWESTVYEAHALLEKEEKLYYSNPSVVSSGLRVALHSCLQATQTQSDNVRQLLAALTAPAALSQLSEMYAPPSPVRPMLTLSLDTSRPWSLPLGTRPPALSASVDKRATWNGSGAYSYSALASEGSPTKHMLRRREKRRSDLTTLIQVSRPTSVSAPTTPNLPGVKEESDYMDSDHVVNAPDPDLPSDGMAKFGVDALDLQRSRMRSGLSTLGFPSIPSPPPSYAPHSPRSPRSPLSPRPPSHRHSRAFGSSSTPPSSTPSSSGSRFTSLQSSRHPLSLSALNNALTGALAAKRYASAHLLALRFGEEEDEMYWGDVREVMALLTSTLADEAARLVEALDQAEHLRLMDQIPSPATSPVPSPPRDSNATHVLGSHKAFPHARTLSQMISFAPTPSHMSKFAGHVDAMSTALNDAREHLEECVATLRDAPLPSLEEDPEAAMRAVAELPAVQAYERLRRELGLALRECERGRERLLDIVTPPKLECDDEDEDEDLDDVPALDPNASDRSDRTDPQVQNMPASPDALASMADDAVLVHEAPQPLVNEATLEMLLTEHLPPQGVEQVFEAEPETLTGFIRERSKLSREERIKLAKARRGSGGGAGLGLSLDQGSVRGVGRMERWGPSGDVVEELKDVIWKVGERRRRMTEGQDRRGSDQPRARVQDQDVFVAPLSVVLEQPPAPGVHVDVEGAS